MNAFPVLWSVLMLSGLVVVAVFGPLILRQASPALVRFPRLAVALLTSSIIVLPTAFLTLGLAMAWVLTGPSIFPVGAGEVCQQCLDAANPFTAASIRTAIPSAVIIAVPTLAGILCAANITVRFIARRRTSRSTALTIFKGASRRSIQGYEVSVVSDSRPWAVAFSPHHGGIALSTGAISALAEDELAAVLAHEKAHLQQRHHAMTDLVSSIAAQLCWIPLIREAAAAVPEYLEIAADKRACQEVSTPALVRALLVLGERTAPASSPNSTQGALFAAGPARIPNLVQPTTGRRGYLPALATVGQILLFGALSGCILLSYAVALATGCV